MRPLAAGIAAIHKRPEHGLTIWMRDWHGLVWAWSCLCGKRFDADLPSRDAAREDGQQHLRPAATTAPSAPANA